VNPDVAPDAAPDAGTLLERFVRTRAMRRFFRLTLVRRVLLPAQGDRSVHRFIRYSMVSGVAIVISQVTILICAALFQFSGILANTVGALMATPASYELNRKWAWGKRGKSHLWKEVAPFWGLTVLGYLASTGTVQIADDFSAHHHITGFTRAFTIMGASLFAYGVIWIAKFIIFNKVIFATSPAGPVASELDGLTSDCLTSDGLTSDDLTSDGLIAPRQPGFARALVPYGGTAANGARPSRAGVPAPGPH